MAWERQSIRALNWTCAYQRVELVQSKVFRSMEVLHGLAAFFETRGKVSGEEFSNFVQGALDRQPELHALAWSPRVTRAERSQFEAEARAAGYPGFRISVRDDNGHVIPAGGIRKLFPRLLHRAAGAKRIGDRIRSQFKSDPQ